MRTIVFLALAASLAACHGQPPCEDQLCIQQRQIDAYRSAALMNAGVQMMNASQPTNVYVYRRY